MRSQRSREGYLLIDHRAAPAAYGIPSGQTFESATITCSHCQTIVILNPDRSRERNHCPTCDHYICDVCAEIRKNTLVCRTMNAILDAHQEAALKALATGEPLILLASS